MNLGPVERKILSTIASGESKSYQDLYGGHQFTSFKAHPAIPIPVRQGVVSTAAGRYQMTAPTWGAEKARLGLADFSPRNQDLAAWSLASRTYQQVTGRDLASDGKTGQVAWGALAKQWPSLNRFFQGPSTTKPYSAPLPPAPTNDLAPGQRPVSGTGLSLGKAPSLPETMNELAELPKKAQGAGASGPASPEAISALHQLTMNLPRPHFDLDFVPIESDPFQVKEPSHAASP